MPPAERLEPDSILYCPAGQMATVIWTGDAIPVDVTTSV
jgi:hypothetical protein